MPPPRKRAKTAKGPKYATTLANSASDVTSTSGPVTHTTTLTNGALHDLPNFPMELQLLIFSFAHPRDLLNLARTCKKFRAFFLHRSNARLWKASRENVGNLPECPPSLSEPAFALLLFSTHCQICGHAGVRKPVWTWFKRYCAKCCGKMSEPFERVASRLWKLDKDIIGIDHTVMRNSNMVYQRMVAIFNVHKWGFEKTQVDRFIAKYNELPRPVSDEMRKALIRQQVEECMARTQFQKLCSKWWEEQEREREAELEMRRNERLCEIVTRLRRTGWKKELDYLGEDGIQDIAMLPGMRQSAKLTERRWEQVMYVLKPFLNKIREERIEQEGTELRRRSRTRSHR
ncbi:hypothetical protein C8Q76DRAFT_669579 [Earliella scabrosa]|nr:hypothetical protein C8Q76DRAFT_669579 [Earliella scabrosa]